MVSYFADPLYYDMPIDGLYIDKDFETVWDGVLPEVVAEDLVLFVKVSNAIYFDDSVYTPIVKYVSLEIVNNFYDLQSRINKAYNLPNDTIIIDVFTDKGQTTLLQDIPLETVKIYPKFTSSWIIDGVSGNIMMPLQAFKDYVYDETGKDVDEFDIEEIKGYFLDFIGSPSEEKEYYLNSLYVDKDFLIPWTQMPEDGENLVVCIKEEGPIIKFSDKHGVPLQEFIFVKYVPFDDEYFTNWVNSMYLLPYGCFTIELYLDEERTVRFTQMPTEDVTVYAKIIRV